MVLIVTVWWDDFVLGVRRVAPGERLGVGGPGGLIALPEGQWDESGDLVANDELGARVYLPATVSARRETDEIVAGPSRLDLRGGERVTIAVGSLRLIVEAVDSFDRWTVPEEVARAAPFVRFHVVAAVVHAAVLIFSARSAAVTSKEEVQAEHVHEIARALAASEEATLDDG